MTRTSEELRRAEELFSRLAELAPDEREAELSAVRARDGALAREVDSLLAHASQLAGFLDQPALGTDFRLLPARSSAPEEGPDEHLGRTVGRYQIERRIASGGMGTVYLAARADGQFAQRVALKIVKRGMDSDEILQRFRRERQTLAALDHPSIARLIDGGATGGGQPYLVMEHVEGEPIDAYCDRAELGVDARLELFLLVCDAVRHAHQKLVVHRDLKPSNILVTPEGLPKLLDFGIASVVDAASERPSTAPRERRLTPEYASPEQVAGAPVATTSDVYSLGVILCELLTGRRPYRFTTRTNADIQRVVGTTPPTAPSELVLQKEPSGSAPERSKASRPSPASLARILRGDLDTIVLCALRKEPERRYPSVERLAGDVRRYLDREPITARRDTLAYRASKFVRRHALASSLGALAIASLAIGGAVAAWQALAAARQRDEAVAARAEAEAMTGFLRTMLESADPALAGPDATVRGVLDEAAARLDAELGGQPLVQASLRATIGRSYLALGLYPQADRELRRAHDQRLALLGPRDADVAHGLVDLATALYAQRELPEARALLEQAVDVLEAAQPESAELATALSSLGVVERAQQNLGRAEELQLRALDIRRRVLGADSLDVAESLNNLAGVLGAGGRSEEGLPLLEEALRIRRERLGVRHPLVMQSIDNLAVFLHGLGRIEQAEPLHREALAAGIDVLGPQHPDVAVMRRNLALLLAARGDLDEAERELRACLEAREQRLPPSDPRLVTTRYDLADLLLGQGRLADADTLVDAALDAALDLEPESDARRSALARGADYFDRRGQPERAAELQDLLAR
jgi:tetratricopeptide (TPR) repeat protein